jgi:DNA-binding transcriptional regulator YiaG
MTESANGIVAGKVLKRDVHGRVHSTAEHREMILAEFERSGLSGPQFAGLAGVPYQTLASWRHRQKKLQEAGTDRLAVVSEPVAPRFAEAVLPPVAVQGAACPPLQVILAGGARLEITQASQAPLAAQLIHALSRSC